MFLNIRKREQGDTIVEVLIVLAVLGLALSIAYATANRSLLNARQAQENAEATEWVQQQIEDLRYWAPLGTTNTADTTAYAASTNVFNQSDFCITSLSSSNPFQPYAPGSCSFGGGSYAYTVQVFNCDVYVVSHPTGICSNSSPTSIVSGSSTFVIYASWPDVLGQGTDSVTQVYRAHPPS